MFDFAAAVKDAQQDLTQDKLFSIVLGCQGSGKSRVAGSLGVRTLFLYTSGESHGPKSAQAEGGANILGVCLDYVDGKQLTNDESYARLLSILSSEEALKAAGFEAIVLDGATELDTMIRGTKQWTNLCLTDKGKHNNYAETTATQKMMRAVLDLLRNAQRKLGVHVVLTCILDVKNYGDFGEVGEATPRLSSYGLAEGLIQQFGDVLVVGPMQKDDSPRVYKIQMGAEVSKVSKELSGAVKKAINYNPRVTLGMNAKKNKVEVPKFIDADLKAIHALKLASK